MSSKKLDICLNILLSNTFDKIGSILTGLQFSFKLLLHFLCNGVTSACFKHDGKIEDFMELLILSQMKFENISEFSLIILVGISEYCDALFSFNSLISISISLKLTSLKLKGIDLILRLHQLELGSKENQEQIGRNLYAIEVFINNFSLLGVKYQFICQE